MPITINENVSSEIVQKKSRFIANLFYVQTEEEANEKIKEIRRKYYDAKHHCYAFSIMQNGSLLSRMSDDGEPSGTAGMPMLNILQKKELVNVLVIVTRYFGGTLLGTGGLVRAYTDATLSALEKVTFAYEETGYELELTLDYSDLSPFEYYAQKNNIKITNIEYGQIIRCKVEVAKDKLEKITCLSNNNIFKIQKYIILREKMIKKSLKNK